MLLTLGKAEVLSAGDLRTMDVLGYDRAEVAVPEPATLMLFSTGLLMVARRRLKNPRGAVKRFDSVRD